jgi:hypothetical protein
MMRLLPKCAVSSILLYATIVAIIYETHAFSEKNRVIPPFDCAMDEGYSLWKSARAADLPSSTSTAMDPHAWRC